MNIQAGIASNHLVLRRPHFFLNGNALYFLASTRSARALAPAEVSVWNAIEHPLSLDELRKRFPNDADAVVASFLHSELCETLEPDFPENRRKILVIEPHADDAALSIGGVMWQRRHTCEFVVATMASRSNFTSYYNLGRDYFNIAQVTDIRRRESGLFTGMVGGKYIEAGLTDVVLRYNDADWGLDYYLQRRIAIAVSTSRSAGVKERNKWIDAVVKVLTETPSEEVWIPLGSPHSDHVLTMNACLAAFVTHPDLIANRIVRVYQDVPYAARFPQFTGEMVGALTHAGFDLEPEAISIDDALTQKLRLVSLYASQFKMHAMTKDIEASARMARSENSHSELLWRVRAMPKQVDTLGIAPESIQEKQQESSAGKWLLQNSNATAIRVLLLAPSGRWADDIDLLCERFPQANFEVYAAPNAAVEVQDKRCDRVTLRRVGEGTRAWGILSLQLACSRPRPTLFNVGDKRGREAKWLSRLWLGSDKLVVSSMNRVIRASEAQSRAGKL